VIGWITGCFVEIVILMAYAEESGFRKFNLWDI
jgi:hypothetical protein